MKLFVIFLTLSLIIKVGFSQTAYIAQNEIEVSVTDIDGGSKKPIKTFDFFDYLLEGENEIDVENVGNHYLGIEIAQKFRQMEKLYTIKSPIGPGNPGMKMVIRKPYIYNGIHKINKNFKKQIKKGQISEEQARNDLNHFVSVAIAIISQDTDEFETTLKKAKSVNTLTDILRSTTLKIL